MKRLWILAACLMLSGTAYSQTCQGAMSFEKAPMRVGGSVSFASNLVNIAGGVGRGNAKWFFGVGGLLSKVSDIDGSTKGFYANVGTERTLGANRKFFACPTVAIFQTFGLHPSPDSSISALTLALGGSVGYEAAVNGTTRIVPFGGFTYNRQRSSFHFDDFDGGDSFTDGFASIQVGVGLILNDRMVIRPGVSLPFASDNGDPTFAVGITLPLGQ